MNKDIFFPSTMLTRKADHASGYALFLSIKSSQKISNLMKLRSQKVFIKEHPFNISFTKIILVEANYSMK